MKDLCNVLVCEDNDTNQLIMKKHMENLGIHICFAPNGKLGVEAVQTRLRQGNPFDLIFMDVHMPIMDGLQAAKELVKIGNQAPVIALTANITTDDIENYKKHGMSDYLAKPFKANDLKECLVKYISPSHTIDKALVMEQYEGDERVYVKVIHSFLNSNKDVISRLRNALENHEIKLAHRTSHSLKGASGMVGATRLSKTAESLEDALCAILEEKSEYFGLNDELNKRLTVLEYELREAFSALHAYVSVSD